MLKKWSSLTLFGLLATSQVNATQLIENSDREKVQVNISARESNRLAIEGRNIVSVVPGIPGQIAGKGGKDPSEFYFTLPADRQGDLGTISLLVKDDQGTSYKLTLVPRAISQEEIILRPPTSKGSSIKHGGVADGRAMSYERRIKDLVLIMSDDELEDSAVDKIEVNKEVPLWKEGRLVLASKYMLGSFVGEKYSLTNISKADMLLVEQELFRRGVRAVSVKNQTLAPGNSTDIFIVRERKENE